MTLTSTGPSGFHIKPVVMVLAVAAFAAAAYVIALQIRSNDQPSASAPAELSAEAVEPSAEPSGPPAAVYSGGYLVEGLDAPPADAGKTPAASQPAPEIVVIEGQGSLYDALIDGKYDLDVAPGDPMVQYVLVPAAAASTSSQLIEGLGDESYTEASPAGSVTEHTPTVSGGPQE